jgi:hypothetical protein
MPPVLQDMLEQATLLNEKEVAGESNDSDPEK